MLINKAGSEILKVYLPKHFTSTLSGVKVFVIWFGIGCDQSWNGIGAAVPNLLSIISFVLKKNTACCLALAPLYVKRCHISLNTAPNCPAKNEGVEELSKVYTPSSAVASITLPLSNIIAHCPGATIIVLLFDITPFGVVFLTIRISFVMFSHLIASFH